MTPKRWKHWINKRRRHWVTYYKLHKGCVDCGYSESPVALHFDHVDPTLKCFNISAALRAQSKHLTLTKLVDEMRKCQIRCANCHSIRTHKEEHFKL